MKIGFSLLEYEDKVHNKHHDKTCVQEYTIFL